MLNFSYLTLHSILYNRLLDLGLLISPEYTMLFNTTLYHITMITFVL